MGTQSLTELLVGDVLDSRDHAFARLQAFAFLNGLCGRYLVQRHKRRPTSLQMYSS